MTEEQLGDWAEELAVLIASLGHLFARPEPREVFADLMEGLLSDLRRKNGWTMAARAGHATPSRIQKFLNAASWSADALLEELRTCVAEHLGDAAASLVLDDTQVQKKGTKSVGVSPQHCGVTGDVRNCQVMVMLTYAAPGGHTFIDRRLYLPAEWTDDRARCREARVPQEVVFATKPQLAIHMLEQALADGVLFAWVVADCGYGRDTALRDFLHNEHLPYVLAVPVNLPLAGPPGKPAPGTKAIKRADHLLPYAQRRDQWERRSCGAGSKGQRYYDWTLFSVRLPTQEPADRFERQLLIRRTTDKKRLVGGRVDYEYAYFLVHAPIATPTVAAIEQAGVRWKIEEDNEQVKQLTGLDEHQVRKRIPWHRTITCTMLAHAFLTVQRARHLERPSAPANSEPPDQRQVCAPPPRTVAPMIRLTVTAVAGLLALTGLAIHHGDTELLRQHHWRTEHQTAAAISHYQRRDDPLPAHLRPSEANRSHQQDPPL
ncbi:IS701 family transposase [Streptomyces sp. H10-C2]|uniref:IS701 family transposase n=1 Tax=unclassified Streptomyces TaxID=2593676 RepID=UPI0024BA32E0|nr:MULTISPECIES: IS701 family transposase [unclassified Streptomyces]MDJ0346523.1 IS701 family transposase [Streptomyces sp. PH10-H1]MDJ0375323.1 IS701 family transposase [Streptomyces sp. H10-C2]